MTKQSIKHVLIAIVAAIALAGAYQLGIYNAPIAVKTLIKVVEATHQSCPSFTPIAVSHKPMHKHRHHRPTHYACNLSGAR